MCHGAGSVPVASNIASLAREWSYLSRRYSMRRLRAGNHKTAKAHREAPIRNCRHVINGALRDVSDGVLSHQKAKEYAATRLANNRYTGGVTSYLEVQQLLARAQRNVLVALVPIYQALGGGRQ
jgi:hypothetical protein